MCDCDATISQFDSWHITFRGLQVTLNLTHVTPPPDATSITTRLNTPQFSASPCRKRRNAAIFQDYTQVLKDTNWRSPNEASFLPNQMYSNLPSNLKPVHTLRAEHFPAKTRTKTVTEKSAKWQKKVKQGSKTEYRGFRLSFSYCTRCHIARLAQLIVRSVS